MLASEDFSQEITTTVLWLNEFHDFDVRCIRLSPYLLADRLLLDVQQVIPLPEASAYTVRVREKEIAVRQAQVAGNADWTKFVIKTPTSVTEPAAQAMGDASPGRGAGAGGVAWNRSKMSCLPARHCAWRVSIPTRTRCGRPFEQQTGRPEDNRKRWHLDDPSKAGDHTWILNNNWGTETREMFGSSWSWRRRASR